MAAKKSATATKATKAKAKVTPVKKAATQAASRSSAMGRAGSSRTSSSNGTERAGMRTAAPTARKSAPAAVVAAPAARKLSMDFIGTFPVRKSSNEKKPDQKKQPTGPVFPRGDYKVGYRSTALARSLEIEFEAVFTGKHTADSLEGQGLRTSIDEDPALLSRQLPNLAVYTRELDEALLSKKIDIAVHNMKDIPLELPAGLVLAAALRREDPRDALVTRATYGAIQELPHQARLGAASKRRIMQVRALRPDIEVVQLWGDVPTRLDKLESENLDAVIVAWASLRRLNISPRYYVALQPEQMVPAACQGIVGVVCRADDKDLLAKLRYIEDSEASWAARCERAFLQKLGGYRDVPVGVYAHRKGTQDPWILDAVIGDPRSGETLKHREIGTSRCKPESLADKAFMGILAKGARKFLPF